LLYLGCRNEEGLKLSRKIVFAEDCMKRSGILDEQTVKQWVADIVNRSTDYINRIDEGGVGVIVDEEHGIFIKFYVTINKITENKITEVINFVMSLENNRHDQEFKQLMYASKSSMDSWNNDVDDEIWNDL